MDVIITKKTYHLFCMRNEWNGVARMCDNKTLNMPVSILCTGLWPSHETCRHHMLNIFSIQPLSTNQILIYGVVV